MVYAWRQLRQQTAIRIPYQRGLLRKIGKWIPGLLRVKLLGLPCGIESQNDAERYSYHKVSIYPPAPVIASVPSPIALQFKRNYSGQFFPERVYPECSVMCIKQGIVNRHGFTLTPHGKLIPEACFEMGKWEERDYSILRRPNLFPRFLETTDRVISLTSPWQANYFHWLFDILPRLHLVERAGFDKGQIFVDCATPFQRDTLQLLGVTADQIIDAQRVEFVSASNLIVPSLPGVPGIMPGWACQYLRNRLMRTSDRSRPTPPRIYVSRSKATRRRVDNEGELVQLLEKHDFTVVRLEELGFEEQVRLFSQAEVIVAAHGAGLANLVFSRKGTKVLEIQSPHWVNACYFDLSYQRQLVYDYLIGEDIMAPASSDLKKPDFNIRVDVSRVTARLQNLLN